jgi:hypothetical protein
VTKFSKLRIREELEIQTFIEIRVNYYKSKQNSKRNANPRIPRNSWGSKNPRNYKTLGRMVFRKKHTPGHQMSAYDGETNDHYDFSVAKGENEDV